MENAEKEIAEKFAGGSEHYQGNPEGPHLQAMNIVYEKLRQRHSVIILHSSAVETMRLGLRMVALFSTG